MNKLVFAAIALLIGLNSYGQEDEVDVLYYGMLTTAQQNALTVPASRAARIYNTTEGKWKQNIGGAGWTDMDGGVSISDFNTFAELDAIVADENLVNDGSFKTVAGVNIVGVGDIPIDAGGIVASGEVDITGLGTGPNSITVNHNLGYSPAPERIKFLVYRPNQQTATGTQPAIGNITTTTFDVIVGSTGSDELRVVWAVFGTDNATPLVGSEVESLLDTELANVRWKEVEVPSGGTAGQVLEKVDGTDYNVQWANASGGADGLGAARDVGPFTVVDADNATLDTGAVNTTHILDGTIGTNDIASQAITSALINNGTIATEDLSDNSVTGAKIQDASIATADYSDGSVTVTKMDRLTAITGKDGHLFALDESNDQIEFIDPTTLGEESATASRSAVLTDADGMVNVNSASAVTITIDEAATTTFPVGAVLSFRQEGAGDITIAYSGAASGPAAGTYKTGDIVTLWQTATDTWEAISNPADDIYYRTIALNTPGADVATVTNKDGFTTWEDIYLVGVYAEVATAGTTGVSTWDVNVDGTTRLSTKLTIDSGETKSSDAATPAVISSAFISSGSRISFDVDGVSTTAPKGDKITIAYIKG